MEILNILILFFVIAVIWTLIKIVFKITAKIFSCGFVVLVAIVILILISGNADIAFFRDDFGSELGVIQAIWKFYAHY